MGRWGSGAGLPTTMRALSVADSPAGFIQVAPPPRCHESLYFAKSACSLLRSRLSSSPLGVVGLHFPSQPVSGIDQNRQTRLPSVALYASTKPRTPYSAPELPTMIIPL